jgi:hypothetical protein
MARTIHRRIFVVGCSRSGTTLVQRLLAAHTRVHTFPETGLFLRALGMRGRRLPWTRVGLTAGKERKALRRLAEWAREEGAEPPDLPPRSWFLSRSLDDAVAFLDDLALAAGGDLWLEKTPRHVLHARRIVRSVPRSLCLHVVRSGPAVVASIVDRARRHPERFPRQSDPSYGVRQWNRSMDATRKALADPGHAVIVFEGLVAHPQATLETLSRLLEIDFQDRMLSPGPETAHAVREEPWKRGTEGSVEAPASKAREVFDAPALARVEAELHTSSFHELRRAVSRVPGSVWLSGPRGGTVVPGASAPPGR